MTTLLLIYMKCKIKLHLTELTTVKLFKNYYFFFFQIETGGIAIFYKRIAPGSVKGTVSAIMFPVELKSNSCVGVFSTMPLNQHFSFCSV